MAGSAIDFSRIVTLTDLSDVRSAFNGVDTVIHLAGQAHLVQAIADDEFYRVTNVAGTRTVAKAAAEAGVRRIVFASSVKAVSDGGIDVITDDTATAPADAYGMSKLQAEEALFDIGNRTSLAINVLRLPAVYGPGVKGNILRLLRAIWTGRPLPIGGVRNGRTMLGLDNLAEFVVRLLDRPPKTEPPFLVSDRETLSTPQFVTLMARLLERSPRIISLPVGLLRTGGHIGDVFCRLGLPSLSSRDVHRLTSSLRIDSSRGWGYVQAEPPRQIQSGLAKMCSWYTEFHRAS